MQFHNSNKTTQTQKVQVHRDLPCLKAVDFLGWLCVPWNWGTDGVCAGNSAGKNMALMCVLLLLPQDMDMEFPQFCEPR